MAEAPSALRLIAAVAALAPLEAQQAPGRAAVDFATVLWLHGGPQRDAEFFATVSELGFDSVDVSIGEDPGLPARHGLRFYGDQAAGKGVLELRDAQWRPAWEGFVADRRDAHLHRPACLSDPAVRAALEQAVAQRTREFAEHGPIAISVGDEVSFTSHCNPFDFCFAPASVAAFAAYAQQRSGDAVALARDWSVAEFGEAATIRPWTTDRIRARELVATSLPRNLAPWSDHREFCDVEFARAVESALDAVRRHAPDVPRGLTGIQPPAAYGGHDYGRLLPMCTFFEVYDIGGARDLAMCLAPRDALQMVTLFPPEPGEAQRLVEARVFDALAHGMAGVITWSSGDVIAGDRAPTEFGRRLRDAFAASRPAQDLFAGAVVERSPVWLIESQASVRAHWMLDSAVDGETWVRRLSSHEATHSTSLATRRSWVRLCEDLGLQPRFVTAEQLAVELTRGRPAVLVLPACLALPDVAIHAVRGYVRSGGVLLADHGAAIYDDRLRRRPVAALDDVFGVRGRSNAWDDMFTRDGFVSSAARLPTGAAAAERGLAGSLGEPTGCATEVQFEAAYGSGRAVYLNVAIGEYARVRLDPARFATAQDIRQRVRRVLRDARVEPPVVVRGDGWPTCLEVARLTARDGRALVAVRVNALDDVTLLRTLGERGARPVSLLFPAPVRLRDVLRDLDLGVRSRFELELDPWRALLLEVREPS